MNFITILMVLVTFFKNQLFLQLIMFGGMPAIPIIGRRADNGVGFMAPGGTIGLDPLLGQTCFHMKE